LRVLAREGPQAVERGAAQVDVLRHDKRLLKRTERPLDVLVESRLHALEIGVEHLLQRGVGVEALSVGAQQLVQAALAERRDHVIDDEAALVVRE
jgi:hypothetical protein